MLIMDKLNFSRGSDARSRESSISHDPKTPTANLKLERQSISLNRDLLINKLATESPRRKLSLLVGKPKKINLNIAELPSKMMQKHNKQLRHPLCHGWDFEAN